MLKCRAEDVLFYKILAGASNMQFACEVASMAATCEPGADSLGSWDGELVTLPATLHPGIMWGQTTCISHKLYHKTYVGAMLSAHLLESRNLLADSKYSGHACTSVEVLRRMVLEEVSDDALTRKLVQQPVADCEYVFLEYSDILYIPSIQAAINLAHTKVKHASTTDHG